MLHYNTITPILRAALKLLMGAEPFSKFRLVGGTALSLQRGHRMSIDIDLFTDAEYGSVDFKLLERFLRKNFSYVDTHNSDIVGFGKSFFVGKSAAESVKLDVYYTDRFISEAIILDGLRMATVTEIIAMKLDVVQRNGRKKDFWDLHELMPEFTLDEMFSLHQQRYPYTHNRELLKTQFTNFECADDDFEPDCLYGKHWELVKLDLNEYSNQAI